MPHALSALARLSLSAATVALVVAGVGWLEEIIAAGWFSDAELIFVSHLGARWVSVFVVSVISYGLISGAGTIAAVVKRNEAIEWVRSLLLFLLLLSWLLALQAIILLEFARQAGGAPWLPNEAQILFVASLVALLWPASFGLAFNYRTGRSLFLATIAALGLSLAVLEPSIIELWAAELGLIAPPQHVIETGALFIWLPYLAIIGPLLWTVVRKNSQSMKQTVTAQTHVGAQQAKEERR